MPSACGGVYNAPFGTIVSHKGFDGKTTYYNNMDCTWKIRYLSFFFRHCLLTKTIVSHDISVPSSSLIFSFIVIFLIFHNFFLYILVVLRVLFLLFLSVYVSLLFSQVLLGFVFTN